MQHLQECLARSGKITADYGFPLPRAFNADAHRTCELRAERNYDPAHEESEAARVAAFMHDYPEQLYAYLELVRAFDNREAAISKLSCITLGVVVRLPQLVLGPAWPPHCFQAAVRVTHVLTSLSRCREKMCLGRLQRPRALRFGRLWCQRHSNHKLGVLSHEVEALKVLTESFVFWNPFLGSANF